jgi:hypothetical protein
LCEPLETTANGKRLVVEDSAACQKTIQTPASQQVLKTDGAANLTWTNGDNTNVLKKSSTGTVEFGKVETDYIVDNAITTAKIVDNAITTAKIVDSNVTAAKIADSSITNAKVSATAAIAGTKISPNFGSQDIITTGSGSFNMPTNHWSTAGGHSIENVGQLATEGSFEINLTSNGYRASSPASTWVSYNANSQTGAAQIGLSPDGEIALRTDAVKSTGSASSVTTRLFVDSSGSVGIGTTNPSPDAILQLNSTTKGFLPPRMTTAQKNAIPTPIEGLMVYDTDLKRLCVYNGTTWDDLT